MIMEVFSICSSIAALGVSCAALMVSADKKSAEHVENFIVYLHKYSPWKQEMLRKQAEKTGF